MARWGGTPLADGEAEAMDYSREGLKVFNRWHSRYDQAMYTNLKIGIAGCGIGGLALGAMLAAKGHSVQIFDQFKAPSPVGSGLVVGIGVGGGAGVGSFGLGV